MKTLKTTSLVILMLFSMMIVPVANASHPASGKSVAKEEMLRYFIHPDYPYEDIAITYNPGTGEVVLYSYFGNNYNEFMYPENCTWDPVNQTLTVYSMAVKIGGVWNMIPATTYNEF